MRLFNPNALLFLYPFITLYFWQCWLADKLEAQNFIEWFGRLLRGEFTFPRMSCGVTHQTILGTLTYSGWWRWAIFNCFGVQCCYVIFSNLIIIVLSFILSLTQTSSLPSTRIHCPSHPFAYPLKLVSGFLTCVCDMAAQKHHGGIALLVKESSPLLMDA